MPNSAIRLAAIAALCVTPALGFAQTSAAPTTGTATAMPGSMGAATSPSTTAPAASTGAAANTNAMAPAAPMAPVTTGLTVKDNTGAAIGQVAEIKPDATGKSMVTIKMGTRNFQVPSTVLAVADGAATINLTKAQIEAQLPKK